MVLLEDLEPDARVAAFVELLLYELALELAWPIEELVLVESVRADGPNRYVPIATFPLRGD